MRYVESMKKIAVTIEIFETYADTLIRWKNERVNKKLTSALTFLSALETREINSTIQFLYFKPCL